MQKPAGINRKPSLNWSNDCLPSHVVLLQTLVYIQVKSLMARSYLYINSFLLCLVHVTYFPYHLKTWILTSFDCNLSIVLWSVSPCLPFLQGIQVVIVLLSQIIRSQWAGIINLVSLKFTVIKLCSFLALRLYTRNKMKRGLAFDTMRRHGECLINL